MPETRTFRRAPITKTLIAEIIRTTHDLPRGEGQYEAQTYTGAPSITVKVD